jgi:hypothetical protein
MGSEDQLGRGPEKRKGRKNTLVSNFTYMERNDPRSTDEFLPMSLVMLLILPLIIFDRFKGFRLFRNIREIS